MENSKEDKIIEEYRDKFEELPPKVVIFDYYDEEYQNLIKKAIKDNEKITPEMLDRFLQDKDYDLSESFDKDDEDNDYEI